MKDEDLVRQGIAHFDQRQFPKAYDVFTDALKIRPENDNAYAWRARTSCRLERFIEAIQDAEAAIRLNPRNETAYHALGFAYQYCPEKIDFTAALQAYHKVLELNPVYVDTYYNRGNLNDKMKFYSKALVDYTRAVSLKFDDIYALNNRGCTYQASGCLERALCDFATAVTLKPDYERACNNRSKLVDTHPFLEALDEVLGELIADSSEKIRQLEALEAATGITQCVNSLLTESFLRDTSFFGNGSPLDSHRVVLAAASPLWHRRLLAGAELATDERFCLQFAYQNGLRRSDAPTVHECSQWLEFAKRKQLTRWIPALIQERRFAERRAVFESRFQVLVSLAGQFDGQSQSTMISLRESPPYSAPVRPPTLGTGRFVFCSKD